MTIRSIQQVVMGSFVAAVLSACGAWTQPSAPVYGGQSVPPHAESNYGSMPNAPVYNNQATSVYKPQPEPVYAPAPVYTPPATQSYEPAPVAPQSRTGSNYVAPHSTYIPSNAPVDPHAVEHVVVYGDTIFNISKRYGISGHELRSWNRITGDNIRIGDRLRVKAPGYRPSNTVVSHPASVGQELRPIATPAQQHPIVVSKPAAVVVNPAPVVSATTPLTIKPAASTQDSNTRQVDGITWMRPTSGSVLTPFGGSNKGHDFGGQMGQPVVAAADGKVVYSGSGLRGYGNLIIIQHNDTYLTAYGNNQSLSVKEGQQVKRGQEIAKMGNSGASRVQLHFEVRQGGKPQDPSRFLPQ